MKFYRPVSLGGGAKHSILTIANLGQKKYRKTTFLAVAPVVTPFFLMSNIRTVVYLLNISISCRSG